MDRGEMSKNRCSVKRVGHRPRSAELCVGRAHYGGSTPSAAKHLGARIGLDHCSENPRGIFVHSRGSSAEVDASPVTEVEGEGPGGVQLKRPTQLLLWTGKDLAPGTADDEVVGQHIAVVRSRGDANHAREAKAVLGPSRLVAALVRGHPEQLGLRPACVPPRCDVEKALPCRVGSGGVDKAHKIRPPHQCRRCREQRLVDENRRELRPWGSTAVDTDTTRSEQLREYLPGFSVLRGHPRFRVDTLVDCLSGLVPRRYRKPTPARLGSKHGLLLTAPPLRLHFRLCLRLCLRRVPRTLWLWMLVPHALG
eukprot:Hpha_TRINITY_DN10916_c0_g1::TRINITY_DN10916_c0_g1_i1::g.26769::m.26769